MFLAIIAFVAGVVFGAFKQGAVLRKLKNLVGIKDRIQEELAQLADNVDRIADKAEAKIKEELKQLKAKIKATL
jgi:Sec-independent protein translocase protein TatA